MDTMTTTYHCYCESTQCPRHLDEDCSTVSGTFIDTVELGPVCATCFRNYDDAGYPLTIKVS